MRNRWSWRRIDDSVALRDLKHGCGRLFALQVGEADGLDANPRIGVTDEQVDVQVLGVPFFIYDLDGTTVSTITFDGEGAASSLGFETVESVGAQVFNAHEGVGRALCFELLWNDLQARQVKARVANCADTGGWIEEANTRQLGGTVEVLRHEAAGLIVSAALGIACDQVDCPANLRRTVGPVALELDDDGGGKGCFRNV